MKQVLDGIILAEAEAEKTVRAARQAALNLRRDADLKREEQKLELKDRCRRIVIERIEQETRRLESEQVPPVDEHYPADALERAREEIVQLICRPFDDKVM